MRHTLVLGAPVQSDSHTFGHLSRIIVENGVANQIVVKPSGLFGGPERIVPISALASSTPEAIMLNIDVEAEWKGFSAFNIDVLNVDRLTTGGSGAQINPPHDLLLPAVELPHVESVSSEQTQAQMSLLLSGDTRVGDSGQFQGLVIDTGLPQALIVDNQNIPFSQVSQFDSDHIQLGGAASAPDTASPERSH